MSKIFTGIFVVLVLTYVLLLRGLGSSETSSFLHQEIRPLVLQSRLGRRLFFLDQPGDARHDYLSFESSEVLIEVDYQGESQPNSEIKDWLQELVVETLNKDVEVDISEEEIIPELSDYSDKELTEIEKEARDLSASKEQAYLHIIYFSRSEKTPSNTGLVLNAESIFIFRGAIDSLSERENIRARIEESTLKHEFGHLLGLQHVGRENCIMSESVEVYGNRRRQFENIPLEFCEESLESLDRLRERVK